MPLPAFLDPLVNLPKLYKVVLGLVGIVVIVAAAYFLLLSPISEDIAKLEAQLQDLEKELAQNRSILAQIEVARRQAAEVEKVLAALTVRLPTEKEIPTLYRNLSEAAFQAGLEVALFQPREPRVRDYYSEIPISISAEGGYHDLGKFFERIAGLSRVVTVGEWKLASSTRPKATLRAELTLGTFTYRPVGSPTPPKTGAK